MKTKKIQMSVGVGGPSIIMIFVVLCLSTLGALTFVTANADWKLTKKTAESVVSYYAADGKAEEFLAAADASLKKGEAWESDTHRIFVSDHQEFILLLAPGQETVRVLSQRLNISSEWDYQLFEEEFDGRIVE